MKRTLIQRFGGLLRVILWIGAVVISFCASDLVAFKIIEKTNMIVDAEKYPQVADHAPVLLKRCDGTNRFTVGHFGGQYNTQCSSEVAPGIEPAPILVTDIEDDEVAKANRELHALVSNDGSTWTYLRIIARGRGYTDVSLVQPTTRDDWQTTWYRMQNGSAHAQKVGNYRSQFSLLMMPIAAAGTTLLLLGYWRLESYVRRKYSARYSLAPATNSPRRG